MCCFVPFAVLLNVLQGVVDSDSACIAVKSQTLDKTVLTFPTPSCQLGRLEATKYVASTLGESIISRTDDTHVVDTHPRDSCCGRQGAVIGIRMIFWSQQLSEAYSLGREAAMRSSGSRP